LISGLELHRSRDAGFNQAELIGPAFFVPEKAGFLLVSNIRLFQKMRGKPEESDDVVYGTGFSAEQLHCAPAVP
jgi:hypothetical protein